MSNPGGPEGPMGFTRLLSPKPTIAAIEGWCVAGGLEIACWCDLRVAGESAQFGVLNRRWGVPLIDGGTQRLPRIIGLGRALDMILTARLLDAKEALAIGLANRVVPDGHALSTSLEMAEQMAKFPQACEAADRLSVYEGLGVPLEEGLRLESQRGRIAAEEARAGAARFTAGAGRGGVIE
jgi:enoyl-CoA hydratase